MSARIDDIDLLKRLRVQIAKFAEQLNVAVSEAGAEVNRTLHWLELEQSHKWKQEHRKRHDRLQQSLEALRMKQLYKGPAGERQSTVDEEKRVKQCRAALEEAEWKLRAIASHKTRLAREAVLFQGILTRLGGISQQAAPAALAELTNLINAVEKYTKVEVGEVTSEAAPSTTEPVSSMASAPAPPPPQQPPVKSDDQTPEPPQPEAGKE